MFGCFIDSRVFNVVCGSSRTLQTILHSQIYIGLQKCIRLVGNCCVYQTVVIAFKITRVWWIRCLLTKKEVIRNLSMLPMKNYLINQTCIREHK
jgi:hypothetical protein